VGDNGRLNRAFQHAVVCFVHSHSILESSI
jgi:hypothetical protein